MIQVQKIKDKYPKLFGHIDNISRISEHTESISFDAAEKILEHFGITVETVPLPQKRHILYMPILLYCFDTYKIFIFDNEDWLETDYIEYNELSVFCEIGIRKDEAQKLAIEKGLELIEEKFEEFLYYK